MSPRRLAVAAPVISPPIGSFPAGNPHRNGGSVRAPRGAADRIPPGPDFAYMNWYCLHTRPRKESQVAAYCRSQLALEAYLPQLREYRTIRRVRRVVVAPLFPRYVFCRFNAGRCFRSVRYAPDVIDVVQFGGKPAIVADPLITDLKAWAGEIMDVTAARSDFRVGDTVRIAAGPLCGLSAVILHAENDCARVEILLSLLRHDARLAIHRDQLAPLATAV